MLFCLSFWTKMQHIGCLWSFIFIITGFCMWIIGIIRLILEWRCCCFWSRNEVRGFEVSREWQEYKAAGCCLCSKNWEIGMEVCGGKLYLLLDCLLFYWWNIHKSNFLNWGMYMLTRGSIDSIRLPLSFNSFRLSNFISFIIYTILL